MVGLWRWAGGRGRYRTHYRDQRKDQTREQANPTPRENKAKDRRTARFEDADLTLLGSKRLRLFRQTVALVAALGLLGGLVDGIGAARRADGECFNAEERPEVLAGGRVGVALLVLQGPLLLGAVNQAQVTDAGVLLRGLARLDEVGNGDGRDDADRHGCAHGQHSGRML